MFYCILDVYVHMCRHVEVKGQVSGVQVFFPPPIFQVLRLDKSFHQRSNLADSKIFKSGIGESLESSQREGILDPYESCNSNDSGYLMYTMKVIGKYMTVSKTENKDMSTTNSISDKYIHRNEEDLKTKEK